MSAGYTAASVERALDIHVPGKWQRCPPGRHVRYLIDTNGLGTVEFTLAQAHAFVVGYAECDRTHRKADPNKPATQAVLDRVAAKGGSRA